MYKSIIILGGGSAGWMTAAYLSAHNPNVNIKVIESANIPTVGVGEATTPYLMKFFKDIGVEDESWMKECNATYKNGVLYQDWDFINSRWWHSFEIDENKYQYWNFKREAEGLDRQDYWTSTMHNGHIAMRDSGKWYADKDGNIPFSWYHSKSYNGWPQHWAYHINADMFGNFLRERSKNSGIEHIVADIVDIKLDDNGISELIAEDGRRFTADLFVDCTGFRRLLIDKVKEENFQSWKPYLTHDRACVIRYDYSDPENEMKPRTRAKCLSSGWYWEIPLYDRISNGYVYSSDFISDDQAEFELRNDIGFDKTKDASSFTVKIDAGYYPKPWSKNVVAVGLSAGFIEPLESTLLFVVQMAGIRINQVLKNELEIKEYNQMSQKNMGDFLDYISIGYYLSHRNDSEFWRSRGENTAITDRMKEWLDECRYELKSPKDKILFVPSSWISKLIGFGKYPTENKFVPNPANAALAEQQMQEIKNFNHNQLISQKEYLDKFRY